MKHVWIIITMVIVIAGCAGNTQPTPTIEIKATATPRPTATPKPTATPSGNANLELLNTVCDGQAMKQAAPYNQTTGIHPVVVFEKLKNTGENYLCYPLGLTLEWQADYIETTELVVCVDHKEYIDTGYCEYEITGGDFKTTDVKYIRIVLARLVEAHTAETIATEILYIEPPICPDTFVIDEDSLWAFEDNNDDGVPFFAIAWGESVQEWLSPFVKIP